MRNVNVRIKLKKDSINSPQENKDISYLTYIYM